MFKNIMLSNKAHKRLEIKHLNLQGKEKDLMKRVEHSTKRQYHNSAASWQEKLNRKLNRKEKKQLYRAFNNYVRSNEYLPTIKYKNQPNYIDFK